MVGKRVQFDNDTWEAVEAVMQALCPVSLGSLRSNTLPLLL